MARKPRSLTVLPGFPHHVVLRGNNRRRLFSYPSDYLRFLRLVERSSERCGVPVHGYSLMANHVHLVPTPPDARTLATFVQRIAQPYALLRNRDRDASGKLFEERYFAREISTVGQLAAVLAYVDLNPVRAGCVRQASDFVWSSCRAHLGLAYPWGLLEDVWTPHDWFLSLGSDSRERADVYAAWIASRLANDGLDRIAAEVRDRDDERTRYTLRLERPDRSTVAEARGCYGRISRSVWERE